MNEVVWCAQTNYIIIVRINELFMELDKGKQEYVVELNCWILGIRKSKEKLEMLGETRKIKSFPGETFKEKLVL